MPSKRQGWVHNRDPKHIEKFSMRLITVAHTVNFTAYYIKGYPWRHSLIKGIILKATTNSQLSPTQKIGTLFYKPGTHIWSDLSNKVFFLKFSC